MLWAYWLARLDARVELPGASKIYVNERFTYELMNSQEIDFW